MDLTAEDVRRTAAQNGMELSAEDAARITKGVNRGRLMSQVLRKYVTPAGEPAGTFSPPHAAAGAGAAPASRSEASLPHSSATLLNLSLAALAAAYRDGSVSPVQATQACLDRIERLDGSLHAFITVTGERALDDARQAEADLKAGKDLGPLHGIPIALKDLYATRGIRTTAHSNVLREWVPGEDSTAAAKLVQAGSVLLGKLSMHEFAFGGPDPRSAFPPARNPWNPAYITGGSSSGSGGALAARMCFGSLGSDTGGSIRNPANMCGVAGIKPTYGLVSRHGVLPLSWSLDHCGPLARTVEDCAILLHAIAGHDPLDPASARVPIPDYRAAIGGPIAGLRLGIPRSWFDEGEGVDPEVMSAFEEAVRVLKDAGARVVDVDGAPFAEARAANTTILIAEAYAYHEENLRTQPHNYGPSVLNRVREGALLSAADYIQAQRCRAAIVRRVGEIMRDVDLIISPAGARPAQAFEGYDADVTYKTPSFTNAFNLTGLPAMSVPCGFSTAGLPIGLQIAGRAFEETTVFRLAHAYEQATEWHTRVPPLD